MHELPKGHHRLERRMTDTTNTQTYLHDGTEVTGKDWWQIRIVQEEQGRLVHLAGEWIDNGATFYSEYGYYTPEEAEGG